MKAQLLRLESPKNPEASWSYNEGSCKRTDDGTVQSRRAQLRESRGPGAPLPATSRDLFPTQGKASHFTQRFAKVLTLSFHAAAALKPVFNGDKNAPENAPEHVATIKHMSEYVT